MNNIIAKQQKNIMNSTLTYSDIAIKAWSRHLVCYRLNNYSAILSMQAIARLAKILDSEDMIEEIKAYLLPFWQQEVVSVVGAYSDNNYRCGGNASAFLVLHGMLPEAKEVIIEFAEKLCTKQSRDEQGVFDMPGGNWLNGSKGFIWIDTVFAVCPFLLWTGLTAKRREFIDEACFQMIKHHEILFDESCLLYHQAINFNTPGALTPAHWSRGNGWAALALAEMVCDLPRDHQDYPKILEIYRKLMEGCRNHQDKNGLLHQAMESVFTYPETSGTGLVLYAMGRCLENGSLDESEFKEPFLRGLKGMLRYVAIDGSVFNCCVGCCGPGTGTTEDYNSTPWVLNNEHAFGPVILLFGQAEQLCRIGKIPELYELLRSLLNS